MSNYLSIAMVTEALRQLTAQALSSLSQFSSAPEVRVGRPENSGTPFVGVNIYLYQVIANAALRNSDLPTRLGPDSFSQRPAAALDLDYLLTFHGDENQLEPDRLAGCVIASLHASPILTPAFLRRVMATAGPESPLAASDLASDPVTVKFSPTPLSIEDLSKLWTVFFQTTHALSAAYRASAILIEAPVSPVHALPVRTPAAWVEPNAPPSLEEVTPARITYAPGALLVLRGTWSDSVTLLVRLGDREVEAESIPDGTLRVALPAGGPVGVVPVQIVQRPETSGPATPERVSNTKLVLIQPPVLGSPLFKKFVDPRTSTGIPVETITLRTMPPSVFDGKLELWLNPAPQSSAGGREWSFSSPWRVPLPIEVFPLIKPGIVSQKLSAIFTRLGLPMEKQARLSVVRAGQCWRITHGPNESYVLRQGSQGLAVYLGLGPDQESMVEGIVFPVAGVPAGRYFVRLHVDGPSGTESVLQPDSPMGYAGPFVDVP